VTKIERSIVIDRPTDEVFEFTHDLANSVLWQTTLVEAVPLSKWRMGVGWRWREVRTFLGKQIETIIEVTEYRPNTGSAVKMVSGPIPLSGTYRLERVDGGTRFTVSGELDGHGFFKLAEPVFARLTSRELEASLGHLKDLLESGAGLGPAAALSDDRVLRRRSGDAVRSG
jgi:uncharacterized membrane protein